MKIAGIERSSTVDGECWRYVIFFQGCLHKCKGCHNPETWNFTGGEEMTTQQILDDLHEFDNAHFYDITLSGGDPFFQASEVKELAKELKADDRNIWAYTGFKFEKFLENLDTAQAIDTRTFTDKDKPEITADMIELLNYIDVVVDGKFMESKLTLELPYRGSTNQRLIDVKESLKKRKVILYNLE